MTKKQLFFGATLFLACTLSLLKPVSTSAASTEGYCSTTSNTMECYNYFSTAITLQIRGINSVPSAHWDQIEAVIKHVQKTFSRTDEDSELYLLNQSAGIAPFKASDDLYYLIKLAVQYAELTNGKFEPTIGPLIDLWGDTNREITPPTKEQIEQISSLIDYRLIEFNDENQTIYLPLKGMQIDLGAISKGYAADLLKDIIKSLGYKHAIINLGGNIMTIGQRHAKNDFGTYDWRIGLTNPKKKLSENEDSQIGIFSIIDKTIVSSGTYERYWIDENTGKHYHHILDPATGYPVDNNVEMVSVITENSAIADALSTSLLILGIEEGLKLVNQLDGVEAIYFTYDREVHPSSGIGNIVKFEITNDTFYFVGESPRQTNHVPYIVISGVVVIVAVVGFIIYKKKK